MPMPRARGTITAQRFRYLSLIESMSGGSVNRGHARDAFRATILAIGGCEHPESFRSFSRCFLNKAPNSPVEAFGGVPVGGVTGALQDQAPAVLEVVRKPAANLVGNRA